MHVLQLFPSWMGATVLQFGCAANPDHSTFVFHRDRSLAPVPHRPQCYPSEATTYTVCLFDDSTDVVAEAPEAQI